jgi:hypothetical protein
MSCLSRLKIYAIINEYQITRSKLCRDAKRTDVFCYVCYGDAVINDDIIVLPCDHIIHEKCGVSMLNGKLTCSQCIHDMGVNI